MTLDAIGAIVATVHNEWGDYGYSLASIDSSYFGGGIAEIHHSDGSRFYLATTRYGYPVSSGDTAAAAVAALNAAEKV